MIREDLRGRRLAVLPDILVNPGSALYGREAAAPGAFVTRLVDSGWGLIKMPPHVARATACATLIEAAVGDMTDYRHNGYHVVIVAVDGLPEHGVWLETMASLFKRSGAAMPPVVTVREDAPADAASLLDAAIAPDKAIT